MLLKLRIAKVVGALFAMATSSQFHLLNLPNEIIELIIESVDDLPTLRRLARTCHRIQDLAENKLYRAFTIRNRERARNIERCLKARPKRAKAIQILNIPWERHMMGQYNFESVLCILRAASNLRDLMFESPECNNSEFEQVYHWNLMTSPLFALFQPAPLGSSVLEEPLKRLQKLTLHLNGASSPYWTPDSKSTAIFLHQTLRELKISCVNIIDDIASKKCPSVKHSTSLKVLILEECNISPQGLLGVLSVPKALERLYLGENRYNVNQFRHHPIPPGCNHLFERKPMLTLEALKEQKDSLKCLTYVASGTHYQLQQNFYPHLRTGSAIDGGFSDFHKLEEVTLIGKCPAFERGLMSVLSPPNLKKLVYKAETPLDPTTTDPDQVILKVPFLRTPSAAIPKGLKNLDIVFIDNHDIRSMDFIHAKSPGSLFIRDVAKTTSEVGVDLRVLQTQNDGVARYFPPYLYGEQEPVEELVFDGEFSDSFRPWMSFYNVFR